MEKVIYDVIKKLEDNNYESYVVGGYVRDKILGIKTLDIDITTKARPKEVVELFPDIDVKLHDYGNVSFELEGYSFDITTFRKDIRYKDRRKPESVIYIDSFEEDLLRRDFTINAICMDINDEIIDLHDGKKDIKRKLIKSIGDPDKKIEEDCLRILRAIRFATIFKFKIDNSLKEAIIKHKDSLKELSYGRKKDELTKIFASKNKKYGIKLIESLGLTEPLELKDLKYVLRTNDIIAMWSMITDIDYDFTKSEKEIIKKIKQLMKENINDKFIQYRYGGYALSAVADLRGLITKRVITKYDKLPIKDRNEIMITADEICKILNKKPDSFLGDIFEDIETGILKGTIKNNNESLKKYIKENY